MVLAVFNDSKNDCIRQKHERHKYCACQLRDIWPEHNHTTFSMTVPQSYDTFYNKNP